ncbi:MAG: winged helix-turn-helix domain-containing protein, partial [Spirochaetota bacterium]
ENAGQVLSRDQLADRLMGSEDVAVDDNTVAVYVRRLREKLEDDPSNPRLIRTVRGLGYRFEEQQ